MNNDIYAEWRVEREKSPLTVPFYIGIVLLFLIGFYFSVISPFGFVALLAAAAAAYFGSARLHVEYEYVFVTNELAIDRILSQRTRKRMKKLDIQKIEKMASMKSHEFDYIKGNNQVKVVDFSSGKADANTYGIAYSDENGKFVYVIEPNDNLLKCMKSAAPRKVMIEQNITAKN